MWGASRFLHVHPLLGAGGFQHCITDKLSAEGVAEIRVTFFRAWIIKGFEKLGECLGQRMLVTEVVLLLLGLAVPIKAR